MKKIIIIGLFLFMLFLVACSDNSNENVSKKADFNEMESDKVLAAAEQEDSSNDTSDGMDEQRDILDKYFTALNELNIQDVILCRAPEDYNNEHKEELNDVELYSFFVDEFPHAPQYWSEKGYLYVDENLFINAMNAYGYYGTREEIADAFFSDNEDNTLLYKTLPNFQLDYKINKIVDASECNISYRDGLIQYPIEDIKEEITNLVEIMPEQVFVANVSCEYSYNGMLYGYDKSWWEYENRGPEDLPTTTYEELIKQKEEHTEDIVIYQYEGQWYVWPLNFGRFDYYTVEY